MASAAVDMHAPVGNARRLTPDERSTRACRWRMNMYPHNRYTTEFVVLLPLLSCLSGAHASRRPACRPEIGASSRTPPSTWIPQLKDLILNNMGQDERAPERRSRFSEGRRRSIAQFDGIMLAVDMFSKHVTAIPVWKRLPRRLWRSNSIELSCVDVELLYPF